MNKSWQITGICFGVLVILAGCSNQVPIVEPKTTVASTVSERRTALTASPIPDPDLPQLITPLPGNTVHPTPAPFTSNPAQRITPRPYQRATLTPVVYSTPVVTASIPMCSPAGEYSRCVDKLLGIHYEIPRDWGTITATLREGGQAGYRYDYTFSGRIQSPKIYISAGGRSRDFMEGRGSYINDFKGFEGEAAARLCSWQDIAICKVMDQRVVYQVQIPRSEDICSPGPGIVGTFVGMVKIDFPEDPLINGFIFGTHILSDALHDELFSTLGESEGGYHQCNEARKQAFDSKVAEIVADIQAGLSDKETMQNVKNLRHLARSIQFK